MKNITITRIIAVFVFVFVFVFFAAVAIGIDYSNQENSNIIEFIFQLKHLAFGFACLAIIVLSLLIGNKEYLPFKENERHYIVLFSVMLAEFLWGLPAISEWTAMNVLTQIYIVPSIFAIGVLNQPKTSNSQPQKENQKC